MDKFDYLFLVAWFALMCAIASHWWPTVRHVFRLGQAPGWPTATATMLSGTIGSFIVGRGKALQGAFITYRYSVNGVQFEGKFVLSNESGIRLKPIMNELIDSTVDVRYSPREPGISVLNNFHDKRFGSLNASQDPLELRQAPLDSLDAAINRM
jgi:hypothetical protein